MASRWQHHVEKEEVKMMCLKWAATEGVKGEAALEGAARRALRTAAEEGMCYACCMTAKRPQGPSSLRAGPRVPRALRALPGLLL